MARGLLMLSQRLMPTTDMDMPHTLMDTEELMDMDTHTDTMARGPLMLSQRLMLLTTDMLLMPHTPMDMVLVLLLTPDTLPPLLPDLPRDLERGLLSLSMDTELSQSPEPPLDTDL